MLPGLFNRGFGAPILPRLNQNRMPASISHSDTGGAASIGALIGIKSAAFAPTPNPNATSDAPPNNHLFMTVSPTPLFKQRPNHFRCVVEGIGRSSCYRLQTFEAIWPAVVNFAGAVAQMMHNFSIMRGSVSQ